MSSYTKESVSDKASNAVSDATNGTVGNPTLLHQTVNLASHTIDFAKGVVGIGGSPASGSSDVIHGQHGVQHSQTLGSLINESRDLAANIIGATRDVTKYYVSSGADKVGEVADKAGDKAQDVAGRAGDKAQKAAGKTSDAAGDVSDSVQQARPIGYVASVVNYTRDTAAAVIDRPLEIAQNIIASAAQKADEVTPGGTSGGSATDKVQNAASNTANAAGNVGRDAKNKARNGANQSQSALANAAGTVYSKVAVAADGLDQQTRGVQDTAAGLAKTALGGAARQADIASSKISR